jgi:hypothetical protein
MGLGFVEMVAVMLWTDWIVVGTAVGYVGLLGAAAVSADMEIVVGVGTLDVRSGTDQMVVLLVWSVDDVDKD